MGVFSRFVPNRHSLISTTLPSIALRIGLVIALVAGLSYLHISGQIEKSALHTLEKYVRERSLREREIFRLAEDNHKVLRAELIEVFRKVEASTADPVREFNALVALNPDGARRSPRARPGQKKELDIWIAKGVEPTPLFRRKVVEFSKVLLKYGPAFHTRFTDTYIALRENANLVFWPEFPDWSAGNPADFDYTSYELYKIGEIDQNPERKTRWSGMYFDDAIKEWMVSASTPYDDSQGRFAGIIGHDVVIGELVSRTINEGLPGTYNILVNSDGRIIAHPKKMDLLRQSQGKLKIEDALDPGLEAIYRRVRESASSGRTETQILDHDAYDQFIAINHWPETGWDFITIYPKSLIREVADKAALFILALGLLSLIVELVILYYIFRDRIAKPLEQFIQATREIETGMSSAPLLQTDRTDEIGVLSRSFETMAERIRRANEILVEKVEQRTRELQELQKVATKNAHAAGMAEIATNILHNIGNSINSVNLSIEEMKNLFELPQLKNLDGAVRLIEEHRGDLAEYMTSDPKGRLLPAYMAEVAQSLESNRDARMSTFRDMKRRVKLIEEIVVSQQQYIKIGGFIEDVDLKQLIEEAISILNMNVRRDGFELETHLESLPPIRGQRVRIMQIVMNLFKNAIEAVEAVESPGKRKIEIRLFSQDSQITLSVRDSGAGIAPENLQKIFQHGFTTKKGGHGFGLHFCANAAREMGGYLGVESPGLNQGATFTLHLPKFGN